ncbi:hypothetical protein [Kamptonema formosum]|uniref:hypothetical protein n=1 Tax=Kamptonema formosum TaxID=331992 RepID=UPI000366AEB0|nr:hypothetical protein [Oscillatoria sp. PCC 10802]
MSPLGFTVPALTSMQDLDLAVERYKSSDISGAELLSLWLAIRDASLNQTFSQPKDDGVPVEESY